jgi:hypothetical protein
MLCGTHAQMIGLKQLEPEQANQILLDINRREAA